MRFAFLLGGVIGFCAGAGTAFFSDVGFDRVFLDGAVGCLAGGLLFRWFWNVLIGCFRQSLVVRHQEAAEAAAKRAGEPPPSNA